MCGIAGSWDVRGGDHGSLERSVEALQHRGPDASAVWLSGPVGLGHARLAIIDRAHGSQPLFTADGRYAVVFNGEIYNHLALRDELSAAGYRFRTRCDTEVIPYLYDAEGPAMVERMRGMFALGVVDLERDEVFLARDRFGKKPLYVAASPARLAFASTLDALLPLLDDPPELDPRAIAEYLSFQYVPGGRSPWAGVEQLPPATWLHWRRGHVERHRYWAPPLPGRATNPILTARSEGFARGSARRLRPGWRARCRWVCS